MQTKDISLIYPSAEARGKNIAGTDRPNIEDIVLDEIGLNSIMDLKNSRLCDYFTMDKAVIEYRQEVFRDMLENNDLSDILSRVNPISSDIVELRRLSSDSEWKAELDDNGNVKGIDDKIKGMKTQFPSQFEAGSQKKIEEHKLPDDHNEPKVTKEEFAKMGYQQRNKLFNENPELYNELSGDK
jgi:hypothetical protein